LLKNLFSRPFIYTQNADPPNKRFALPPLARQILKRK